MVLIWVANLPKVRFCYRVVVGIPGRTSVPILNLSTPPPPGILPQVFNQELYQFIQSKCTNIWYEHLKKQCSYICWFHEKMIESDLFHSEIFKNLQNLYEEVTFWAKKNDTLSCTSDLLADIIYCIHEVILLTFVHQFHQYFFLFGLPLHPPLVNFLTPAIKRQRSVHLAMALLAISWNSNWGFSGPCQPHL